jgi:hypothetical protein
MAWKCDDGSESSPMTAAIASSRGVVFGFCVRVCVCVYTFVCRRDPGEGEKEKEPLTLLVGNAAEPTT